MPQETNEQGPKRKNRFEKARDVLRLFTRTNAALLAEFPLEGAMLFTCPVTKMRVQVQETVSENYEVLEYFVLRLYAMGYRDVQSLTALTGMTESLVAKLLEAERTIYGHIDMDTGELTEFGRRTLAENRNKTAAEQYRSVSLYNTRRVMMVDAVTGTVIPSFMEQDYDEVPISVDNGCTLAPRSEVELTEELTDEIKSRLSDYKHKDYVDVSDMVVSFDSIKAEGISYRIVPLVRLQGLRYPLMVLRGQRRHDNVSANSVAEGKLDKKTVGMILSLSHTDAAAMEARGVLPEGVMVRGDANFDYLLQGTQSFRFDLDGSGERMTVRA